MGLCLSYILKQKKLSYGKAVLNLLTAISFRNEHCPQNFKRTKQKNGRNNM